MKTNAKLAVEKTLEYLNIDSVGGDTKTIREHIWKELETLGVERHRTKKGLVYATLRGKNDSEHRVVTAHVDTLGAMVKEILPNGRLRLSPVGGFAWGSVEGENLRVYTADGTVITGTLLPDHASVHIYSDEVRNDVRDEDTVSVRLDAKPKPKRILWR